MSRSNDRRPRARAYGRRRLPLDIEDTRKDSRARAHRMGPSINEWD